MSARHTRPLEFEAEVIGGLEAFAAAELAAMGATLSHTARGSLRFRFDGSWRRLLPLRTVVAVHVVAASGLPRPGALLDDGRFQRLGSTIGRIRALFPAGSFTSFRLSAAGSDSSVFRRFRDRLSGATGLRDVREGGDLLLCFKRAPIGGAFELTARLSPRPLSARAWRVCNLPGALNATVASVMAALSQPSASDVYLNLACGSGTLLVERAALAPAGRLVGCDADASALACAAQNVAAAGLDNVELERWDISAIPLPQGSVDALAVDLPFGQLVGSHRHNERLYPLALAEAARIARPGARLVAVTQQGNLFERCLQPARETWTLESQLRVDLPASAGTLKPRIYVLKRRG